MLPQSHFMSETYNTNYATDVDDCIIHVMPNDVILGRGTGPNNHEGNTRFRMLANQRKKKYKATKSRQAKTKIASDIVNQVLALNGRLLKRRNGIWIVANRETFIKKAKNILRMQCSKEETVPGSPLPQPKTAITERCSILDSIDTSLFEENEQIMETANEELTKYGQYCKKLDAAEENLQVIGNGDDAWLPIQEIDNDIKIETTINKKTPPILCQCGSPAQESKAAAANSYLIDKKSVPTQPPSPKYASAEEYLPPGAFSRLDNGCHHSAPNLTDKHNVNPEIFSVFKQYDNLIGTLLMTNADFRYLEDVLSNRERHIKTRLELKTLPPRNISTHFVKSDIELNIHPNIVKAINQYDNWIGTIYFTQLDLMYLADNLNERKCHIQSRLKRGGPSPHLETTFTHGFAGNFPGKPLKFTSTQDGKCPRADHDYSQRIVLAAHALLGLLVLEALWIILDSIYIRQLFSCQSSLKEFQKTFMSSAISLFIVSLASSLSVFG